MTDRRLTLIRNGLARRELEGEVEADRFVDTRPMRCATTLAAIRKAPDAAAEQEDQLLFGEAFDVLETEGEFSFGQARRDGYVGWVETAALADGACLPTHWVQALSTFAFSAPDLKTAPLLTLSMNSLVTVTERQGRFARILGTGWVFEGHLASIETYRLDPAAVASEFAGAPYLWGGRSSAGLDCSGLSQQAHYACAMTSARDTDMQAALGEAVDPGALTRGDLVFWKGHVGLMLDGARLLHANAHFMRTNEEGLGDAEARIRDQGAGAPTAWRRIARP